MAVAVVHGHYKLARFEQSLGGAVAVAAVFHNQPGNDLFHPIGDLFTFCHRIADIFQIDGNSQFLEFIGDPHDISNFIIQFFCANVYDSCPHER